MSAPLSVLAALHRHGFHAALVAGLLLMPTVIAVGFLTERPPAEDIRLPPLRGSIDSAAN